VALWGNTLACYEIAQRAEAAMTRGAIFFQPEAYTTSGPKLMGRNAAGESFLRGYLLHSSADELWVQVQNVKYAQQFAEIATAFGRTEPVKVVDSQRLGALAEAGTVYFPGPNFGKFVWQRALFGHGAWSLCGITHTTSSENAMDGLAELLSAPVYPWDALICTSTAVKDNVVRLLQAQADYLQARFGATRMVLPQLPVIPLGIHTKDFVYAAEQRAAARDALQADADNLVITYMGRLSFHAKAHPLAMYQALEIAAKVTGKKVVLVECGWHANEFIAKAFAEAAAVACPSVKVVTLDGRVAGNREIAWAGGDVFCSLSDNIQETFGIVPIEAMAAGLPVVVADWDGYKDTVRDGVDGFRVPTLMPAAGLGVDLAQRHALAIDTYDMYCGHASTVVAVDVDAAAQAFASLFQSPELRARMGAAGRERAQSLYDWSVIIPRYEALWAHLGELRTAHAANHKALAHPWPARLDPFHAFASYPTRELTKDTRLALVDDDIQSALVQVRRYRQLSMVEYAKLVLPAEEEVVAVLEAAVASPGPAWNLVQKLPRGRQAFVFRALAWLVKLHVLKVIV
jgi:starch synthase